MVFETSSILKFVSLSIAENTSERYQKKAKKKVKQRKTLLDPEARFK